MRKPLLSRDKNISVIVIARDAIITLEAISPQLILK